MCRTGARFPRQLATGSARAEDGLVDMHVCGSTCCLWGRWSCNAGGRRAHACVGSPGHPSPHRDEPGEVVRVEAGERVREAAGCLLLDRHDRQQAGQYRPALPPPFPPSPLAGVQPPGCLAQVAVRDPHGFRPLVMGRQGDSICFASETCALDLIGYTYEREVGPPPCSYLLEIGTGCIRMHNCGNSELVGAELRLIWRRSVREK
jgi:hypothetical protein